MNRREALKKLGLSFGFMVSAPAAVSFLQSCSTADSAAQGLQFFTQEEVDIITKVVDIILPATADSPSASEVGVPEFIDQYLQEVVSLDEQDRIKEYLTNFISNLKEKTGKNQVNNFTEADIEPTLANSLKMSPEEAEAIHEKINNYVQAKQNNEETELFEDVASYALLTNIRSTAIWSYKNSEKVGEEVLAYEPIPGQQAGCVDLQEATGGRAWSL